jgi:4-hydroxy-2-oxoheptanedioate aldolase
VAYPNKLRQVLADGRVAFGATTQIPATALVEILGLVGYDFTMIDCEHGLFDMQTAGELIRAAHGANLTPLVRIQKNDPAQILKALDMGAQGVIIPHISNQDQVSQAIEASKYWGKRGACPLVRAAGYGLWDWQTVQEQADRETMVIPLIEDMHGAEHIREILSVDGIDIVFIGPFDMSVSAGFQGNVKHPQVLEAIDSVLEACKGRSIPVMHALTGGPDVQAWIEKGVRLILQSADSAIFARAHRTFLESMSRIRNMKVV